MKARVSLFVASSFLRPSLLATAFILLNLGGAIAQTLNEAGEYIAERYLSDVTVQSAIAAEFSIAKDAFDCFAIASVFYKGVESGEIPQEMSQVAMSMALFSNFALEGMGFSKEQIAQASVDAMKRLETDGYYDYAFDSCVEKVQSIVGQ